MDRDSFSHDQDLIKILKGLESNKAEYPPELLAARRKFFIEQLEKRTPVEAANEQDAKDQQLLQIFGSLKALEPEYPPQKLARRRSIFKRQVASRNSIWNVLRSSIRNFFAWQAASARTTSMKFARASVIAAGIAMVAFVAYALYGNAIQSSNPVHSQNEIPPLVTIPESPTPQAEIMICTDGNETSGCLAHELENSHNLTDPGNGQARPAVAKDTVLRNGQRHPAAHVNDGLYGPEASWVSNSPNSWIKIDLGSTTEVNTIAFSRDRLGLSNDGDPGRFIIALATKDDVYADGNSSNDEREYVNVYDSRQTGFDGTISGAETVIAVFDMQRARFIKITFENAGTTIDEVEAFVSRPFVTTARVTKRSPGEETLPDISTAIPTNTPLPIDTVTAVPTDTALPVDTTTPVPIDTVTPVPVDTATPIDTPLPVDTAVPTDMPTAVPTDTILPLPTDILFPPPINVPVPLLPTEEPTPTETEADIAPLSSENIELSGD